MTYFLVLSAIVVVALSPLLRRLYFERFWEPARGTVVHLDGSISTNPGAAGSWVWVPIIEYEAAGHRFTGRVSYWQRFNAKPKYSVGDEVKILYDPRKPSRFILDSWIGHVVITIVFGVLIVTLIRRQ